MNWTDFLTATVILYLLWYCFNFIKDLTLTRGSRKTQSGFQHYNIKDLIEEEEKVVDIREENFLNNSSKNDQQGHPDDLRESTFQENEGQFITFKEPPDNQGIPLQQFLKMARDKAVQSANKIQYS